MANQVTWNATHFKPPISSTRLSSYNLRSWDPGVRRHAGSFTLSPQQNSLRTDPTRDAPPGPRTPSSPALTKPHGVSALPYISASCRRPRSQPRAQRGGPEPFGASRGTAPTTHPGRAAARPARPTQAQAAAYLREAEQDAGRLDELAACDAQLGLRVGVEAAAHGRGEAQRVLGQQAVLQRDQHPWVQPVPDQHRPGARHRRAAPRRDSTRRNAGSVRPRGAAARYRRHSRRAAWPRRHFVVVVVPPPRLPALPFSAGRRLALTASPAPFYFRPSPIGGARRNGGQRLAEPPWRLTLFRAAWRSSQEFEQCRVGGTSGYVTSGYGASAARRGSLSIWGSEHLSLCPAAAGQVARHLAGAGL